MKILSIIIDPTATSVMHFVENPKKLTSVVLTTKSFFGKTKTFTAHPTSYGPTYGSDSPLFYMFVNELGKELSEDISQQICNFLKIQQQIGKL